MKLNEFIVPWLPFNVEGMVIWPFILYRGTPSSSVRAHEWCYWRQQAGWLVIYWYVMYLSLAIIHWTTGPKHPFEKPAYAAAKEAARRNPRISPIKGRSRVHRIVS
jgi:hypothetical protein